MNTTEHNSNSTLKCYVVGVHLSMKTAAPMTPRYPTKSLKLRLLTPSVAGITYCASFLTLHCTAIRRKVVFPTTLEAPLLSFSRALDQIKPPWVVGTISTNLICSLSFLLSKKSSPLSATSSHEVTAVLACAFKRLTSNSQEHSLPTDAWIIFSYTRPTQEKPETLISSSPTFSFCWPSLIQLWFSSLVLALYSQSYLSPARFSFLSLFTFPVDIFD